MNLGCQALNCFVQLAYPDSLTPEKRGSNTTQTNYKTDLLFFLFKR